MYHIGNPHFWINSLRKAHQQYVVVTPFRFYGREGQKPTYRKRGTIKEKGIPKFISGEDLKDAVK